MKEAAHHAVEQMKEVAYHAVEHPTVAKIVSGTTVAMGGATAADLAPWTLGIFATSAGILASVMVIRAQRAIRIKTELEIDALRRAEAERRERAMQSPGRRQDDPSAGNSSA